MKERGEANSESKAKQSVNSARPMAADLKFITLARNNDNKNKTKHTTNIFKYI